MFQTTKQLISLIWDFTWFHRSWVDEQNHPSNRMKSKKSICNIVWSINQLMWNQSSKTKIASNGLAWILTCILMNFTSLLAASFRANQLTQPLHTLSLWCKPKANGFEKWWQTLSNTISMITNTNVGKGCYNHDQTVSKGLSWLQTYHALNTPCVWYKFPADLHRQAT